VDASDLALTAKGQIYFTDTMHKSLWYIDAKGQKRVVYEGGEIAAPAALSLTPDQALLIVGDALARFSWSFQVAADGSLVNGEPYIRLDIPELDIPETSAASGVTGVTVDSEGQVYFADALDIRACEPNGRCAQILSKPEYGTISSVVFGGRDLNWLYVTEGGKLFRRPVKRTGAAAWAPVKPPRPLL